MAHKSHRRTWIIALSAALVAALAVGAYVAGKSVGADPVAQPSSTVTATAPAVTKTATPAAAPTPTTSEAAPTEDTTAACNLPAGDQTVPTTTPKVDAVEPYDAAGVPVSNTYGPTQRTGEVWGCFQKSPTGAAFAATYILLSGSRAASWNAYTVGFPKRESDSEGGNSSVAVIGFKVKAYKPGDALIDLATKSEANGQTVYLEYPTHMVWVDGMWKATTAGLSNQPSLRAMSGIEDYVPWVTQ